MARSRVDDIPPSERPPEDGDEDIPPSERVPDDGSSSEDGTRYGWGEGDIEIIKEGTGDPLLSEEELERILRENGPLRKGP